MKIIKFTALWCADCIVMRPTWSEIAAKFPEVEIINIDHDDQPEELAKFNVKKIPFTILLDNDGREVFRLEGLQNKKDLLRLIEENLNK